MVTPTELGQAEENNGLGLSNDPESPVSATTSRGELANRPTAMPNEQIEMNQGKGVPASPSGCRPSASAAEEASSRSGIPNAAWQPIETAPRDGTEIDLWVRSFFLGAGGAQVATDMGRYPASWWGQEVQVYTGPYERREGEDGWLYKDGLHSLLIEAGSYRATHWMPIPEPPASGTEAAAAAETVKLGSVHDGPVAEGETPLASGDTGQGMREALENVVAQFESDFVLDGQIVDNPPNSFRNAYADARTALTSSLSLQPDDGWPSDALFALGATVQKKGRASWRGKIVGWYRTELTALGLAVESVFEPGSVQIYPQTALEAWVAQNTGASSNE